MVIANAGLMNCGSIDSQDAKKQQDMMDVNMYHVTCISKLFYEQLIHRALGLGKKSALITISSVSCFHAMPYNTVYSASKAFVLSFT